MLTIVQRGGSTREKPPEEVRGFSSRLPWVWDGLCFAVPFNDPTQDAARDLVMNAAPSTVVGLTWERDNRGNPAASLRSDVGDNYLGYLGNPQHQRPSSAITLYARVRRLSTWDTSGGIIGKRYADIGPFMSWGMYVSDVTANAVQGHLFVPAYSSLAIDQLRDTYALPTTQWASVFLRWQSGSAPTLDVLGERGERLSSATYVDVVTGTIGYAAVTEPVNINATQATIDNSGSAYSQCMTWSRRLTDTELQALVADPYGWYSPRRSTVLTNSPYPLVFGGGEMRGGGGMGGMY